MTFRVQTLWWTAGDPWVAQNWISDNPQKSPDDPIYDPFLTMQWPPDESNELWITPNEWPLYNSWWVLLIPYDTIDVPWMTPRWSLDDPLMTPEYPPRWPLDDPLDDLWMNPTDLTHMCYGAQHTIGLWTYSYHVISFSLSLTINPQIIEVL